MVVILGLSTTIVLITDQNLFLNPHSVRDKAISDGTWMGIDLLMAVNLLKDEKERVSLSAQCPGRLSYHGQLRWYMPSLFVCFVARDLVDIMIDTKQKKKNEGKHQASSQESFSP